MTATPRPKTFFIVRKRLRYVALEKRYGGSDMELKITEPHYLSGAVDGGTYSTGV